MLEQWQNYYRRCNNQRYCCKYVNSCSCYDVPRQWYRNSNDIEARENYGEDGTGEGSDLNFPVSIEWSPGRSALTEVKVPDSFTNAQFRASLQGSSTKLYRVKTLH